MALPTNTMLSTIGLDFVASGGHQRPAHFESAPPDVLEASFAGAGFQALGLSVALEMTPAESIELDSYI